MVTGRLVARTLMESCRTAPGEHGWAVCMYMAMSLMGRSTAMPALPISGMTALCNLSNQDAGCLNMTQLLPHVLLLWQVLKWALGSAVALVRIDAGCEQMGLGCLKLRDARSIWTSSAATIVTLLL